MSFPFSWIAVQGLTREQILDALGMEVSDVRTDLLEGVALFDWPDDWLVVLSDDDQNAIQGPLEGLGALAKTAVARGFNPATSYNVAVGFEDGEALWSVTVNPDRRVFRIVGEPPEQLESIIANAKAEQDNTDVDLFFDIPAVLAESICGFRLGKGDPDSIRHVSLRFTEERQSAPVPRRKGFFARLFGRG